ncbi:MAG TPA: hypothetical protein VH643_33250 [Gemmataceae bacterium]|jgi:hypothetical protein
MRTWTRIVPAVLLVLPLTMASVRAADAETNEQKIARLRKDVDDLRRDMKSLGDAVMEGSARGAKMAEDLSYIKDTLLRMASASELNTRRAGYAPLPTDELREIRDLLHQIARAQEANIRRAAYAPTPSQTDIPVPTTGTITVRNRYSATATVRINGRVMTVPPFQDARMSAVPVGPYSYDVEVDGFGIVQPLRTETLRPNGRIITVFPQFGG